MLKLSNMKNKKIFLSMPFLILSLLLLESCQRGTGKFREDKVFAGGILVTKDVLNLGHSTYIQNCAACHGMNGDGHGPAAKGLVPPPRNFQKGLFKFGNQVAGGLPSDEDLMKIINDGLPGTAMFPWPLGKERLFAVVQYIKTLAPEVWEGKDKELGKIIIAPKDPYGEAYKTHAIEKGKEIYHAKAMCHICHMGYVTKNELNVISNKVNNADADFPPDIYMLKAQDSEYGAKVLPPDFTWHDLRTVQTNESLYVRISAGVGGVMPNWNEILEPQEVWALVYYINHLRSLKNNPEERKQFINHLGKIPN